MSVEEEFKLVVKGGKRMQLTSMGQKPPGAHITAASDTAHTSDAIKLVTPAAHLIPQPAGSSLSRKAKRAVRKADPVESLERKLVILGRDMEFLQTTIFKTELYRAVHDFKMLLEETRGICTRCVPRLSCYGLGSLRFGTNSRIQLALYRCLTHIVADIWAVDASTIQSTAFDPLFDDDDRAVLGRLGIAVGADDTGKPALATCDSKHNIPMLLFMPHCNSDLYDNVLEHAYGTGSLPTTCIVGNSFSWYRSSWHLTTVDLHTCSDSDKYLRYFAANAIVTSEKTDSMKSCAVLDVTALETRLPTSGMEEEYLRALDCTR